MVKLDKIKFAAVIAYICSSTGRQLDETNCRVLDGLIDIDIPPPDEKYVSAQDVNAMLQAMADGKKIEAIKLHRTMTGMGLKESKDMIEIVTSKFVS